MHFLAAHECLLMNCVSHRVFRIQLQPHLRASLHLLMMSLPRSFIRQIADRMACGLAIILRSSYHYFATPNEWAFMADTLDMLANHHLSRVLVFDGIASTVEYALPSPTDSPNSVERPPALSKEACDSLTKILTRFVMGVYQHDYSLSIPAMLCLEKVYRDRTSLVQSDKKGAQNVSDDDSTKKSRSVYVPDRDAWQNFAVAIYSTCRSPDEEVSKHGTDCFLRTVMQTSYEDIPAEKWISILYLMVSKQPPIAADVSRSNTLNLIGQLLIHVLPQLSMVEDLREDLTDLIQQVASLIYENLRTGRRGNLSPLFESTLRTATYLSNHMSSDEWKGEKEFSAWASETILEQLERAGAKVAKYQQKNGLLNGEIEMTEDSERSEISDL
jgi:hypothetical protein